VLGGPGSVAIMGQLFLTTVTMVTAVEAAAQALSTTRGSALGLRPWPNAPCPVPPPRRHRDGSRSAAAREWPGRSGCPRWWEAPPLDPEALLYLAHTPYTGGTGLSWHLLASLRGFGPGKVLPGVSASAGFGLPKDPVDLAAWTTGARANGSPWRSAGVGRAAGSRAVGSSSSGSLNGGGGGDGGGAGGGGAACGAADNGTAPLFRVAYGHNAINTGPLLDYGGPIAYVTIIRFVAVCVCVCVCTLQQHVCSASEGLK